MSSGRRRTVFVSRQGVKMQRAVRDPHPDRRRGPTRSTRVEVGGTATCAGEGHLIPVEAGAGPADRPGP